ncbi:MULTISPECIES: hypothetical protein [Solimonas]|nr:MULTISPECIES: hypothetical protein [Solimonas]
MDLDFSSPLLSEKSNPLPIYFSRMMSMEIATLASSIRSTLALRMAQDSFPYAPPLMAPMMMRDGALALIPVKSFSCYDDAMPIGLAHEIPRIVVQLLGSRSQRCSLALSFPLDYPVGAFFDAEDGWLNLSEEQVDVATSMLQDRVYDQVKQFFVDADWSARKMEATREELADIGGILFEALIDQEPAAERELYSLLREQIVWARDNAAETAENETAIGIDEN